MDHQDDELSDVVVIIVDEPGMTTQAAAQKLKSAGLSVSDVDEANGAGDGNDRNGEVEIAAKAGFCEIRPDGVQLHRGLSARRSAKP